MEYVEKCNNTNKDKPTITMTTPAAQPGAAAMGVVVPRSLMVHYDLYARVEGIRESTARVFACAGTTNMAALTALRSGHSSFIHLFIHTCIHSFIHSFSHQSIHPSIHPSNSYIHPFIHSFIYSFKRFISKFLSEAHLLAITWPCLRLIQHADRKSTRLNSSHN